CDRRHAGTHHRNPPARRGPHKVAAIERGSKTSPNKRAFSATRSSHHGKKPVFGEPLQQLICVLPPATKDRLLLALKRPKTREGVEDSGERRALASCQHPPRLLR